MYYWANPVVVSLRQKLLLKPVDFSQLVFIYCELARLVLFSRAMRFRLIVRLLFGFFCLLALCQCNSASSSNPPQATGTSDGGGGVIADSEKQQIIAAIEGARSGLQKKFGSRAPELDQVSIKLQNLQSNPKNQTQTGDQLINEETYLALSQILNPRRFSLQNEKLQEVYNPYVDRFVVAEISDPTIKKTIASLPSSLLDYLPNIETYYEESKACPAPDKNNADASVTAYDLSAKVCFSLFNLTKIPVESLEVHLAGLWMHELAHMNGMNEATAIMVQDAVVANYENVEAFSEYSENLRAHRYARRLTPNLEFLSWGPWSEKPRPAFGPNVTAQSIYFAIEDVRALSLTLEIFPEEHLCMSLADQPADRVVLQNFIENMLIQLLALAKDVNLDFDEVFRMNGSKSLFFKHSKDFIQPDKNIWQQRIQDLMVGYKKIIAIICGPPIGV